MSRSQCLAVSAFLFLAFGSVSLAEEGLVAHWKLDEAAGSGVAVDSSPSGLNGTLVNIDTATAWVSGTIGGALSFAASDSYVQINSTDIPAPWTAVMWIKRVDATTSSAALMDSSSYSLRMEQWSGTNKLGITKYGYWDHTFNYEAPVGAWTQVAFVGTTSGTQLYANGALVDSTTGVISLPMGSIGKFANTMQGALDDVRVYNIALDQTAIQALFDAVERPTVESVSFTSTTEVKLTFNEAITETSAETLTNYAIDNGVTVSSAVLEADGVTVTLTTSTLAVETAYTLTVNGIASATTGRIILTDTTVDLGIKGFLGLYYDNLNHTGTPVKQLEKTIDFSWGWDAPAPGVPADNFSSIWMGRVVPEYTEDYTFATYTDDGIRLWVNGELVIDKWDVWAMSTSAAPISLTAGVPVDIVMLHSDKGGEAAAKLYWSSASVYQEIVPERLAWTHYPVDVTAPSAPTNLSSAVDGTNVTLTWDAATDDNRVAGYKVSRDGTQIAIIANRVINETLCFGTSYSYEVVAFDFAGNESTAATLVVLTDAAPHIGTGDGLAATYYDEMDLTGTSVSRIDPTVNFDWGWGSPDSSIGAETFSASWTGEILAQVSETYTFYANVDDGVRLWVGERLIIDDWSNGSRERSGTITLQAGEKYPICMEMFENTQIARAQLRWSSASTTKDIVPQTQLTSSNRSDLAITSTLSSATSPVWVEGDVDTDAASVWVSVDSGTAFEAVRESGYRWYANSSAGALGIPLSSASPSASVQIQSKDESDVVLNTVTETITWTTTELTGKDASTDSITIRKGDSLLFIVTGGGGGWRSIDIDGDGTPEFNGAPGTPYAALYDTAGEYTVIAKKNTYTVGTLLVRVIDATEVLPIGVSIGYKRWKTIATTSIADVTFVPSNLAALDVAINTIDGNSAQLTLSAYEKGTTYVQARLGGTSGPVILSQEVHAFELTYSPELAAPVYSRYEDGDKLCGMSINMDPQYNGHNIRLFIFTGGALFEDTGTTEKNIETEVFGDTGWYSYYLISPSIICHDMEVLDEE